MDRLSHSNFAFSVANNGLGPEGAKILAEALHVNTSITKLNLCNNGIGKDGAVALAKALEVNASMTSLK